MKVYTPNPIIALGGVTEWNDADPGTTIRAGLVGVTITSGAGTVTLPWATVAVEHDVDANGKPILPDWLGLETETDKRPKR
jgi:hypothetical protein